MYLQDRMKRRWEITLVLVGILVIGLLLFIKLYVDETHETLRQYNTVFTKNITDAQDILKDYSEETFDAETKYATASTQIGIAREMLFLADAQEERQVSMNELYYAFVKYPQQMPEYCPQVAQAFEQINSGQEEQGYEAIDNVVAHIDKLGY